MDPNVCSALSLTVDTNSITRMNFGHAVILQEDGKNFKSWKCIVPGYLQSSLYAWEATNGTLTPHTTGDDKQHYLIGNKNARTILLQVIDPNLFFSEFSDDGEIVAASEIWKRMKERFRHDSGSYKELAIASWLAFQWKASRTVNENIETYKGLVHDLTESESGIPSMAICSRLVSRLPRDWDAFKQNWTAREEGLKTFAALIDQIRSEAARRATEDNVSDVTAFMSRVSMRGRNAYSTHGRRVNNFRRNQSTTSTTSTITCWTCGQAGHKAISCNRRGAQQNPRGRGGRRRTSVNFSEVFMADTMSHKGGSAGTRIIVDSGATNHVLNDKSFFHDLKPLPVSREVRFGNSATLKAQGCGDATMTIRQGEKYVKLSLTKALYVPSISVNLISLGQIVNEGFTASVKKQDLVLSTGQVKVTAQYEDGLFVLHAQNRIEANVLSVSNGPPISLREAHEALAHIGKEGVKKTLNENGIAFYDDLAMCDACQKGKQHRQPSKSKPKDTGATSPGFIHADVCSATESSLTGKYHFLCLTDDYTKYRALFFLRQKDEVPDCI